MDGYMGLNVMLFFYVYVRGAGGDGAREGGGFFVGTIGM